MKKEEIIQIEQILHIAAYEDKRRRSAHNILHNRHYMVGGCWCKVVMSSTNPKYTHIIYTVTVWEYCTITL